MLLLLEQQKEKVPLFFLIFLSSYALVSYLTTLLCVAVSYVWKSGLMLKYSAKKKKKVTQFVTDLIKRRSGKTGVDICHKSYM